MKRLLGNLAALSARTDAAERQIHDRAVERDGEIMARMDELRPKVMLDDRAALEYKGLVRERGTVARVIGQAQERMAAVN